VAFHQALPPDRTRKPSSTEPVVGRLAPVE
jgi:hypothetical protein